MASYADDTKPYVYGKSIGLTTEFLEKASDLLFQWFSDNYMKANEDTFDVLLPTNENMSVNIGKAQIQNSSSEKPL